MFEESEKILPENEGECISDYLNSKMYAPRPP